MFIFKSKLSIPSAFFLSALSALFALSCAEKEALEPATPTGSAQTTALVEGPPPMSPPFLLLSQVQFQMTTNANGKSVPKPGAAKVLQLQLTNGKWSSALLQDPDSRVFHKAICRRDDKGLQLLTIGATDAHLKTWRWQDGKWSGTSHWNPRFGGKWDRLRDFEFADIDHDNELELIIATHDQGVIAVADEVDNKFVPQEIFRKAKTFIHEIEVGDTDGDKKAEFFATPSAPNRSDSSQGGGVTMFQFQGGKYIHEEVVKFKHRHAKEILVTDMNEDGVDELYISLEAHSKKEGKTRKVLAPLQILQMTRTSKGEWKKRVIATLPKGIQARVLLAADLRNEGSKSLIVTTMRDGIWEFQPTSGKAPWNATHIDPAASGFELAAGVADLDQDGQLELYAAADNQDEVRSYHWNGSSYEINVVVPLPKRDLTWTIEACH